MIGDTLSSSTGATDCHQFGIVYKRKARTREKSRGTAKMSQASSTWRLRPATHDPSLSADNVGPCVRGTDIVGRQNDDRPTMTGRV